MWKMLNYYSAQSGFYKEPFQNWVTSNFLNNNVVPPHSIKWKFFFIYTLWQIWLARNRIIFKQRQSQEFEIVKAGFLQTMSNNFLLNDSAVDNKQFSQIIQVKSTPPPGNFIKLNKDGCVLPEKKAGEWIMGRPKKLSLLLILFQR